MINKIKEFWSSLSVYERIPYKLKDKELNKLYELLKEEFAYMTFEEMEKMYDDRNVNVWELSRKISIYKYKSKKKLVDYIFKNLPAARITDTYDYLERIEITFDIEKYKRMLFEGCKIKEDIIPNLSLIIGKLSSNSNNKSFHMLIDKYDTVFSTLYTTILEMKESDTLDLEAKQSIIDILKAFIEEFDSLEAVFNKRVELDQQAIKDSLKRRLEDELTLVNKIKTNWNSELLEQEVKIEV